MNGSASNGIESERVHPFSRVSAFTSDFRGGNPAGVVVLDPIKDSNDLWSLDTEECIAWMSSVAIEMDMAETGFLRRIAPNKYTIRWYCAPTGHEETLCGHCTLACAHILYSKKMCDPASPIHFVSKYSGDLYASHTTITTPDNTSSHGIQLDFPAKPSVNTLDSIPTEFLHAMTLHSPDQIVCISEHNPDLIIEVNDESIVHAANAVDFSYLSLLPQYRGILMTAAVNDHGRTKQRLHGQHCDFTSRCFFANIAEDPVTGSAHCALIPYWTERLNKQGQQLTAFQASRRGGVLYSTWEGDRVILKGNAVTVLDGKIHV